MIRHALRVFFRSLDVEGADDVPDEGPLLLAANHPNTLIDVLLVATRLDRKVGFVAKAPLFKNPLVGALLRFFGAVPVFRRDDGPLDSAAKTKNKNALAACEQVVAEGGAILIFPEGVSQEQPRLQRLKTGLARIALGAEERAPGQVTVVPVALIYDDPETFRSRAHIRFSPPIRVAPYRDLAVGTGDPTRAVRALTEAVAAALSSETIHVEREEHDPLVRDLDSIYGQSLSDQAGGRLAATAAIAAAVNSFAERDPERVERVRRLLTDYRSRLETAAVEDVVVRGQPARPRWRDTLAYWLSAPVAWWGLVNHAVLYNVPRLVLRLMPVHPLYSSSIKLGTGLIALFACYAVQGYLVYYAGGHFQVASPLAPTLLYVGTLPLCGMIALLWSEGFYARRRVARIQARRRGLDPETLLDLTAKRTALVGELDAARATYLAEHLDSGSEEVDDPW